MKSSIGSSRVSKPFVKRNDLVLLPKAIKNPKTAKSFSKTCSKPTFNWSFCNDKALTWSTENCLHSTKLISSVLLYSIHWIFFSWNILMIMWQVFIDICRFLPCFLVCLIQEITVSYLGRKDYWGDCCIILYGDNMIQ